MEWDETNRQLEISFQDLEHILNYYDPESGVDFDEALRAELFLNGLRGIQGEGVDPKDIQRIVINYQARTIWASGTPPDYLQVHKGHIAGEAAFSLRTLEVRAWWE